MQLEEKQESQPHSNLMTDVFFLSGLKMTILSADVHNSDLADLTVVSEDLNHTKFDLIWSLN